MAPSKRNVTIGSGNTASAEDRLLTSQQLSARWNRPVSSLANDRSARRGPQFIKLGPGSIRYRLSDVLAFESASIVETSDANFERIAA